MPGIMSEGSEQILPPGVQHGEKADLCPQTFGIGRDDGQGLGRGSEQNAVDETFVLVSNGRDLFGEREDDMKIVRLENLRFPFFDPFRTRQRLALRAMSVAAANGELTIRRLMGSNFYWGVLSQ